MKRSKPTEEQSARAAERRARMRQLAKTISAMSTEERAALIARVCPAGVVTIEGRPLSIFNACMVLSQSATATVLGGFQQWRKAGRCVRKGEHGIAIWAPIGKGSDGEAKDVAEDDQKRPRFLLVTMFDVAQTDALEGGAA